MSHEAAGEPPSTETGRARLRHLKLPPIPPCKAAWISHHYSYQPALRASNTLTENRPPPAILATLAKPSVLWFFMLSGYLLLGRQEDLRSFFTRRITKIAFPLAFFSLFYLWVDFMHPTNKAHSFSGADLYEYLTGGTFYHLWFLHALLVCYLIIPFLRLVVRAGVDLSLYLLILWIFFGRWMPLERRILGVTDIVYGHTLGYLASYAGFLLIGWLLAKIPAQIKHLPGLVIIWILSSASVCTAGLLGPPWETFGWGYASPFLMVSAASSFLALKLIGESRTARKFAPLVSKLAPLSTGIYLLHPLVLRILTNTNILGLVVPNTFLVLLKTIGVYIVSAIIVALIRRSSFGRSITP